MPKERLRMRQIKEILRLKYELDCSQQSIANATGIARSTVKDYLSRASIAGIQWPLSEEMTNEKLNDLLFPVNKNGVAKIEPIWDEIHKQLKRKGVTIQLLWEEYKRDNPDGYQYSWFSNRYRTWARKFDVWMPQTHKAGDKIFVDYSGLTIPIWSTTLQNILYKAEVFVGVLGASDLIFCIATKTQKLHDWINAHKKMFEYYGGVAQLVMPDNLRSGVTKAHRYEPVCNATYEEFARHYGCVVMPARAYKPQDKSKAEKSVQLVQQRILAPLRDQKFISIEQVNGKISELLEELNHRHSKVFNCTRWELFNQIEKEVLRPLPTVPYELAEWYQIQVNGGYHVYIKEHNYSVPYRYVRKKVDIRVTAHCVEVLHQDERIACHVRDDTKNGYTTVESHRPEAHRQQSLWQADRLKEWACGIGQNTQSLIHRLFSDSKRHLHQKERSALGILRLSHNYSESLLEQACEKALAIGTERLDSIESLLKRGGLTCENQPEEICETPEHDNVRGADYYH